MIKFNLKILVFAKNTLKSNIYILLESKFSLYNDEKMFGKNSFWSIFRPSLTN
jgi:hypothetical protein